MLATACGSPGVPIPPSLELPRPVTDLHVFRKGDTVHLSWSAPTQTTEHRNLRKGGSTEICRAIATTLKNCGTPVAKVAFRPAPRQAAGNQSTETYSDQLSPAAQAAPVALITYAVNILNTYGRSAGLSNQVQVPAAPTLPQPGNFHVQLTADGVQISWDPVAPLQIPALRFFYRVYRRQQGNNKDAIAGELPVAGQPTPGLVDHNFVWEKTYDYRLTVVTAVATEDGTERQVEGDDTPVVEVIAHDVFPPATPVGLQAVFSGPGQKPFIDLSWTPNLEPDLAGYNVYRREESGEWAKLNSDPIKSPAFRDGDVLAGHAYSYSVSAIDTRGNESPRSEPASETVP